MLLSFGYYLISQNWLLVYFFVYYLEMRLKEQQKLTLSNNEFEAMRYNAAAKHFSSVHSFNPF